MNQNLENLRQKTLNWKLADDAQLCTLLGDISKSVQDRCEVMEKKLHDMKKNTVKLDCIVQNFNVELSLLSNRKFIETVIQEDDALPINANKLVKPVVVDHHADTLAVLKESLVYAQQLANSVTNPYDTDLPPLIGSEIWLASTSKPEASVETYTNNEAPVPSGSLIPACPPPPPVFIKPEETLNRPQINIESRKPKELNTPVRIVSAQENKLHGGSLFDSDSSSDENADSPKSDLNIANEAIRDNETSVPSLQSEDTNSMEEKYHLVEEQPAGIPSLSDLMNATAKLKKINTSGQASIIEHKTKEPQLQTNGSLNQSSNINSSPLTKKTPGISHNEKTSLVADSSIRSNVPESSKTEPIIATKPNSTAYLPVSSKSKPPAKSLFDSDSDDGDLFKPVFSSSTKSFTASTTSKSSEEKQVETKPNNVKREIVPPKTTPKTIPSAVTEKKLPSKVKSLFDSDSDSDDMLTSIAKTSKSSVTESVIRESELKDSREVVNSPETNISCKIDEVSSSSKLGSVENPEPNPATCSSTEKPDNFVRSLETKNNQPAQKEEIAELVGSTDIVSPLSLLEDQSNQSDSHSNTSEMSGKLNKSAFANMLNSKLAMGPPPVPGSKLSKTTDDAAKKKDEDNIPGTAHSATLPRMGGLPRRPQLCEEPQPAAKLFEDNPKLLSCITKNRPKGPSRRPPTKRLLDKGITPEPKTAKPSKDVDTIREKLSKLTTKDEKVVKNSPSSNGHKPTRPAVKKPKGLFDSDSDEETVETKATPIKAATTSTAAPRATGISIKTESPKSKIASTSVTVTATKPAASVVTAKPVRKSLFDDDSDEDLDLFRKKK